MGLFDKLKETFAGDDKPKTFEVTFDEERMGMTLGIGPNGEPVVTQGGQDSRTLLYLGCSAFVSTRGPALKLLYVLVERQRISPRPPAQ